MNVTITSMTAVKPSARSEKLAATLPALIHGRSCPKLVASPLATAANVRIENKHAPTAPAMQGMWHLSANRRRPTVAMTTAPNSGSAGMSQRYMEALNMAHLARIVPRAMEKLDTTRDDNRRERNF